MGFAQVAAVVCAALVAAAGQSANYVGLVGSKRKVFRLVERARAKRRLFIAKAERSNDAGQLQLEFAEKMRELDALAGVLAIANDRPEADDTPARDGKPRGKRTNIMPDAPTLRNTLCP